MSITSVNASYVLTIPGLYSTGQELQGFAADDLFDTESIDSVETMMGADGKLSAGKIYVAQKQNIMLMADSPSIAIFEQWHQQQLLNDVFAASAIITLVGLNTAYVLTNGYLTGFTAIADAKRVLQPRKFTVTWESIAPGGL